MRADRRRGVAPCGDELHDADMQDRMPAAPPQRPLTVQEVRRVLLRTQDIPARKPMWPDDYWEVRPGWGLHNEGKDGEDEEDA